MFYSVNITLIHWTYHCMQDEDYHILFYFCVCSSDTSISIYQATVFTFQSLKMFTFQSLLLIFMCFSNLSHLYIYSNILCIPFTYLSSHLNSAETQHHQFFTSILIVMLENEIQNWSIKMIKSMRMNQFSKYDLTSSLYKLKEIQHWANVHYHWVLSQEECA
jgi:hypothetical protein